MPLSLTAKLRVVGFMAWALPAETVQQGWVEIGALFRDGIANRKRLEWDAYEQEKKNA